LRRKIRKKNLSAKSEEKSAENRQKLRHDCLFVAALKI
jgi:hypothetical protein